MNRLLFFVFSITLITNVLAEDLKNKDIKFVIEPYIRFKDKVGEQATMFFKDPSGNYLEFKSFQSDESIFAKEE